MVREVYRESGRLPWDERFGMTAQIRRAAVSVASNIAEGCSRDSARDFGHFLKIALGSANEVLYLCLLARDLGFLESAAHDRLDPLVEEVRRMLIALILRTRPSNF